MLINACAVNKPTTIHQQVDKDLPLIDSPWVVEQARCGKVWREIIVEWKKNGGGLKASIVDTRKQIAGDKKSRFAKYIRATWVAQEDSGDFKQMEEIPKSNEDYSVVANAFDGANRSTVFGDCGSDMLNGLIWAELVSSGDSSNRVMTIHGSTILRFSDTPYSVEWSSPNAQIWTAYWLLRRVDP
jgi:hypothetical protein